MATSVDKKQGKRRGGQARNVKKQSNDRYIKLGLAVIAIGLVAFGIFQFLGNSYSQNTSTALVSQNGSLESVSIDGDHSDTSQSVAATDRETLFLGPPSDPATYTLAEAGQLDQPTLVWFHANW